MSPKNDFVSSPAIVWFRRDLRISNNPALDYAMRHNKQVIAVYIHDHNLSSKWKPGAASRWWCHESLKALSASLLKKNVNLHFFAGDTQDILRKLCQETGAKTLCWNSLYEPDEAGLEKRIIASFSDINLQYFNSYLLFKPGTVMNKSGDAYRVFTPFWKSARKMIELTGINICDSELRDKKPAGYTKLSNECSLEQLELLDKHSWYNKFHRYWKPGEAGALEKMHSRFLDIIEQYDTHRDLPSTEGTSRLSPHLHFGEITPSQIVYRLQDWINSHGESASTERFLAELGWREFANHVLWHFPHTSNRPMNKRFEKFWSGKADSKLLSAWQTGNTGVPIVDAGMRQLWETGWMHNRVRMIVGSFLTKNLDIHWLHGAKWFWDTLVDADLASNTLGWQWVAGCGVDAAPYYRIFNPYTQEKKFDPASKYVNKWIGNIEDKNYPSEVVNISESRESALVRYKDMNEAYRLVSEG